MKKIDHVGIAVSDMQAAKVRYEQLLQGKVVHEEFLERDNLNIAFFELGGTYVELLEPVGPDSPVARFIARRGEGIHHVAYEVADIRAEMKRLKQEGYRFTSEEPYIGARNKLVCFIHPASAGGVLTELCQKQV